MFRFDDEMKRLVLAQRLGFIATVDDRGRPNLSPKGTTTLLDEKRLVFADIRSPNTVCNLERNPAIEVNVVDPITRRGFRFKGRGVPHRKGPVYERALQVFADRRFRVSRERVRTAVVIEVDEARPLISPAYDSGADIEEVARPWRRRMVASLGEKMTTDNSATALVRRFHILQGRFYGGGEIDPLLPLLAESVTWHVPGRNAIAGDYLGRAEVCSYFERRRELARATFELRVRELIGGGELVFQLVGGTVERDGRTVSWETAGVLRVGGGVIHECRLLPFDQHLFDQIWS